jgi:hypothetical protein
MTEWHPRRVEGLEAHEVEDGLVVYQQTSERVHYLNATAAVVYELCTGEHNEREIEDLVAEAWSLPEAPSAEVRQCLENFREEGVIT